MSIRAHPIGPAAYDPVTKAIPTIRRESPDCVLKEDSKYAKDNPSMKPVPKNKVAKPDKPSNRDRNGCCWNFMFTLLLITALASILALFWTNFNLNGTVSQITEVLLKYCEERIIYAPDTSEPCNSFLDNQNM